MKNTQGFGLLGLIIATMFIALIAGGVYYYRDSQERANVGGKDINELIGHIDEAEEASDMIEGQQRNILQNY